MHRKDSHAGGRIPIFIAFAAVAILIISSTVLIAVHDADGEPVVSGIAVDGLTYDIYDDGTATVTGFVESYTSSSITIPGTVTYNNDAYRVTAVGNGAFDNTMTGRKFRGTLTFGSPEDPSNIVTIGNRAFFECDFTGSLVLPQSVITIGNNAFFRCDFTGSLTIPPNVTDIGDAAFNSCNFTGSLTIPPNVTKIYANAFDLCNFNGTLTICGNPHLLYKGPHICTNAFKDTKFISVYIYGGELDSSIFYQEQVECAVNSIFIADGVFAQNSTFPWSFYKKEGDTKPLKMDEIQNKYFEINDDRTKMIKVEDRYAVRFDTQGSNYILPVATNGEITLPSAGEVTKEGYTLLGWDRDISVTDPEYEPGGTLNVTESTMLYAIWGGTITFNPMGGTVDPTTIKGKGETELPTPTSTSPLTFRGWYDGSATYSGTYDITKDVTLYAVWGEPAPGEKHVLSFDLDGGNGSFPIVKTETGTYTLPADAPTKTGYTFKGWKCGGETYQAGEPVDVSADKAFKAEWTAITYTVKFNAGGGEGTMADQTFAYDEFKKLTENSYTKTECEFLGWSTVSGGRAEYVDEAKVGNLADVSKTVNLYAVWEAVKKDVFVVSFDLGGGTGTFEASKIAAGGSYTIPSDTPSKTGYSFVEWKCNGTTYTPGHTVTVSGDMKFEAQWTINQYTITFDTDGGSAVDPITQDYGSTVSKPANPTKQGYVFVAWDRPVPATMPAENITINAIWKAETGAEYVIIFEMEGGSGSFSTMRAAEGEDVTLPEDKPVRTGYEFGGWFSNYADKIYNPGDTIEGISSDMTLKALWTPVEYTVVFHGEGVTDTQKMTYDVAAALKPNAFEKEGFDFKGWSFVKDSKAIAFEDEREVKNLPFNDNKECHLYAVWGPKMDIESGEAVKGEDITLGVNSDNIGAVTVTGPDGTEKRLMPDVDYEVASVFGTATVRTLSAENPNGTYVKIFGTFTEKLSAGEYLIRVYTADMEMSEGTVEITDPRPDPPTPPEPVPTPTYYEVSYDIAGGSEPGPGTMLYKKGDTAEVAPYNGHKDGYYFDGWSCGGKTYKAGDEFVVSENMKFTAIWVPNSNPVPEPSEDNTGLIAGIVVGVIAAVALVGGAVYFIKKR